VVERKKALDEYLLEHIEDYQRATIVYDIDGPIGISESDNAWISLLAAQDRHDDTRDLSWINISELNTAIALREALDRFIAKKEKERCQKAQNAN